MLRDSLRRIAVLSFLVALVVSLFAGCEDKTRTPTPTIAITYAPSPPVAGERILVNIEATDVGVVELYQGEELLARVANPIASTDVPPDFYVYIAKNAAVPRAVGFSIDGKVEVTATGTPVGGGVPDPPPVVDAGSTEPPAVFTETCPGFVHDSPDAGVHCGPGGLLVELTLRNDRTTPIRSYANTFVSGKCRASDFGLFIEPGESQRLTGLTDQSQVLIANQDFTQILATYFVQAGTSGVCNLAVK